jgi:hypothetical protein
MRCSSLIRVAAILSIVATPPSLAAQGPAVSHTRADHASQRDVPTAADALTQLHARLRDLTMAQEKWWVEHGTYTTDVSALGLFVRGRAARDSVQVTVLFAGGRGWSGVATHPALRGKSCVLFVGNPTDLPRTPATQKAGKVPADEGTVACDEP